MASTFEHPFKPNVPISLADATELRAFEDIVAQAVDPTMTKAESLAWEARTNIKDAIRPPKFNGSIANIELMPLDEPYEKLQTLHEDGWQVSRLGNRVPRPSTDRNTQHRLERCLGFHMIADAISSGRGVVGELQLGLWYLPIGRIWEPAKGQQKNVSMNGGRSIVRVVTKPRHEPEAFMRLGKDSARIAVSALRQAMLHPLRNGMRK
jgi:hypothetical protein